MCIASFEYGWYLKSLGGFDRPKRTSWPRMDDIDFASQLFDLPRHNVIMQRQRSVVAYELVWYPQLSSRKGCMDSDFFRNRS